MENPFVYVVDDEPGIALLCNRILTRAGYTVTTETSPRKAIEYLKENKVNLLLVDIRMPEVDGFEVIQHAQRLQPDAAVLIMTGHRAASAARCRSINYDRPWHRRNCYSCPPPRRRWSLDEAV